MASEADNRGAFLIQGHYCRKMDAPVYAGVCAAIARGLTRETRTGAAVLDWPGEPTRDALPLRLMGGLHALVRAGADLELAAIFSGEAEPDAAALNGALARHDDALLPWLDGPPQTNEPGRSGALMVGLMEVARRFGPKIEVLEIGSSGGLNLLIGNYRYDLGGVVIGPDWLPVTIRPEWRGAPPEKQAVRVVGAWGCDVRPLDLEDPAVASRLMAYIWPEMPERLERFQRAVEWLREVGVDVDEADAADWLDARLAEPQEEGVTRVLMHSVVWQYLPDASAERIRRAMERAGARATANRPLAWVAMEPDRAIGDMMVQVRSWPGERGWEVVATTHAHGAWIRPGGREGLEPAMSEAMAQVEL